MRPNNNRKRADDMKAEFAHPDGDHLTLLNAYHAFKGAEQRGEDPRKWCHEHFLSFRHLTSADDVRAQLKRIMEVNEIELMSTPFQDKNYYTNIHLAPCWPALFMQVAMSEGTNKKIYKTVKDDQQVMIHPSTVVNGPTDWVV